MLACFVLFSWTGEQLKWIQMQLLGFWSGLKEAHDKRTNGTKTNYNRSPQRTIQVRAHQPTRNPDPKPKPNPNLPNPNQTKLN